MPFDPGFSVKTGVPIGPAVFTGKAYTEKKEHDEN